MKTPPNHLEESLAAHFGHPGFRPGQREVIVSLMEGRPALAVLPTGGGKSICYQLPSILLEGLTLVISPLIALMKDQVDVLKARGIEAARLDSTLTTEEVLQIYDGMKSGRLKILYVAPERLVNENFVIKLARTKISLLAIDEAHCISEWGHNFRPEYLRLSKVAKKLGITRVLALTATATPEVCQDICNEFAITESDFFRTSFHRPNLAMHISPVTFDEREARLIDVLRPPGRKPAIVYVTLQRTAEQVAAFLVRQGFPAKPYHAGLADEVRSLAQEEFMTGKVEVIVATIAFGMGIDKSDIRTVIHYNLPKTLENYQQEIGRAGRDGLASHCEMLACGDDLTVLQNFIHGDRPEEAGLRMVVDHLLRQGQEFDISRYELSRASDVRPLVLETVITYLEHENILEPMGAIYTTFQIGFHHSEERIVAGYSGERQQFLKNLFANGRKGRRWLTLDIAEASETLGQPRERIMKALGHLEEGGDIELKPSGVRHRFRLLEGAAKRSPVEVAKWLSGLFTKRETKDLERLGQVLELAACPGCTTSRLLGYFGESMTKDCGHCGHCQNPEKSQIPLPAGIPRALSLEDCKVIQALANERLPALLSPRQQARFLCGITSPATSRDRLSKHPAFARFEDVPFELVLEACTK
ncbi:MAG: RecQ family ATP-dependent DNA helicase [Terrimicrobiaceae bacterium]